MHPVVRSVLAVIGGYLVMVVVVAGCSVITGKIQPQWMREDVVPTAAYLTANLIYSATAAIAGGFAAGWLATRREVRHAAILAALVFVLGVASARLAGDTQPRWYQMILLAAMPLVTIGGGFLSAHLRTVSTARASSR